MSLVLDTGAMKYRENPSQPWRPLVIKAGMNWESMADTYDPDNGTYEVGQYVLEEGMMYRCIYEITTPEAWTPAHWTSANVADELASFIIISDDQPTEDSNKIWIAETTSPFGVQIPTMDDHNALGNTLSHKADLIYDTASGAIASFPDGADGLPVKNITVAIEPVQSGTGDPSPTNVRPISGRTGCEVTRAGKNLLKNNKLVSVTRNGVTITVNADGTISLNGTCTAWFFEQIFLWNGSEQLFPPGDYIISGGVSNAYISIYLDNDTKVVNYTQIVSDIRFTVPQGRTIKAVRFEISANYSFNNAVMHLMIRPAIISDSAYEPYISTTIPISWQSSAGTVYGGTLDVTTGVLTVDRGIITDFSPLSQTASLAIDGMYMWSITASNVYSGVSQKSISSFAPYKRDFNYGGIRFFGYTNNIIYIFLPNNDRDEVLAFLNGQQIVYELASPTSITLTATEVETLLGQNNIFADCGPVSVEYPCDTKLYIERLTAPEEDDMIANQNIASGKYFMVGNNLYLSTAAILAGDPIKPGTNCTLTNLAAALNALNS